MRIYLAFRFTGEDPRKLEPEIRIISDAISKNGHEVFCCLWHEDYFKQQKFTNKQILEFALQEIDKSDALFAYIKSPEKSEGMLLETGYALAKGKPIFAAIKKGVKSNFVAEIAQHVAVYQNLEDLLDQLSLPLEN